MKTSHDGGLGWDAVKGCQIVVLENTLQRLKEIVASGIFPLVVVNQRVTVEPLLIHWSVSFFFLCKD